MRQEEKQAQELALLIALVVKLLMLPVMIPVTLVVAYLDQAKGIGIDDCPVWWRWVAGAVACPTKVIAGKILWLMGQRTKKAKAQHSFKK